MRRALPLLFALAACSADPVLLPDAAPADAGLCGGLCGAGTVCEDGRCVTVDGGAADADGGTAPPADAMPADAICLRPVWTDADGDGYGDPAGPMRSARCNAVTPGFATRAGDCDDGNPAAHPGATERCDGIDEDCDGRADDDPAQVYGPGGTVPMHPLNDWCEAQVARSPELMRIVRPGLRRCLSSRLAPSSAPRLSAEARCHGSRQRTSTTEDESVCWRDQGEIPCL